MAVAVGWKLSVAFVVEMARWPPSSCSPLNIHPSLGGATFGCAQSTSPVVVLACGPHAFLGR